MTNTIVPILEHKIPEFVRDNYPNFVNYIKDYLIWMEQDGNFLQIINDWKHNMEPSNEVEPYLDAMLRNLGFESGQNLKVRKGLLISLLRDFYLSRGTEASFRFLFRILFNSDVEVRYPREEMLIPSYAEYGERHFIYTSALTRNSREFSTILAYVREHGGLIRGLNSGAVASIEDITIVYGQGVPYLQIEILEPLIQFQINELVNITGSITISEQIKPIVSIVIDDAGSGYVEGDTINITGPTLLGRAQVTSTKKGGVDAVQIQNPGSGYSVGDKISTSSLDEGFGFSAYVTAVDSGGGISAIEVQNRGYNFESLPMLKSNRQIDDAVLIPLSDDIGAIQRIEMFDPFVDFENAQFAVSSQRGSGAVLNAEQVSRWVTRGWSDRRGFIGESSTLIDSDKYQQFSYTLVSPIASTQYDDFVDDLLHPAGYIRNSSYEISAGINLNLFVSDIETSQDLVFEYQTTLDLEYSSEFGTVAQSVDFIVTENAELIVTDTGEPLLYVIA